MKVTALAGGVGGAKLLVGLDGAVDGDLSAIVNTADDAEIYGVHVSPDVDIVTYWLAGIADVARGWGISGDSFDALDTFAKLGVETWFRLGDRDLATCLYRTQRLASGATLSAATADITAALGVRPRLLPMCDQPVRTRIVTADGRTLEFQEYFVRERTEVEVVDIRFAGIADAVPGPGVIESISEAERVVVCPSNPLLSIGPILALPGVRAALQDHPCVVAVTPLVKGAALKGPADKVMKSMGHDASASGVAKLYADFADVFVVDASDADEADLVEAQGLSTAVLDTVMTDHLASERLAKELVEL